MRLLIAILFLIAGCDKIHEPDQTITQQHIDKAVQLCTTNGGIKGMQKQGYRFWFTCHNGMHGVVIDKEP